MMRFGGIVTVWWCLALGLALADDAANPKPRVAVISDGDDKDLAALVTTELSSGSDIKLLERDELAKIGDETKLQELAGSNAITLGKLAGADGLIFLDKRADGTRVRFTAVGLGYTLFDDPVSGDVGVAQEAKAIAHLVRGETEKLKLDPAKAIPISVLNVRADYASPEATALERKLTLLFESRLTSVPEYVVLERRHAWSLGFEHSLDPTSKSVLSGAYVIDGTLTLAKENATDLTIHLRLRSPTSQVVSLEIHGLVNDLPALVEKMATQIQKSTGATSRPSYWETQKEARQYLMEGMWASHHGTCEQTIAALDSAELLGETAPDLLAARIPTLCALAVSGIEPVPYGITPKTTADPGTDERIELVRRAIGDQVRYEQGRLESRLVLADSQRSGLARTWSLHESVSKAASTVLVKLMDTNDLRVRDLQSAIRNYENYAPLDGKFPGDWGTSVSYANEWSVSQDEELAYYRAIFDTFPNPVWSDFLLDSVLSPDKFCARFLFTSEQRSAASLKFFRDLLNDPSARPLALYYLEQRADVDHKDVARRAFYDHLGAEQEKLRSGNRLGHFLRLALQLEKDRKATVADPKLIGAIHCYLQHDTSYSNVMVNVWQPDLFPPDDAPRLLAELKAYEKKADAAGHHDPYVDTFYQSYRDRFGNPNAEPETSPRLAINRFWYPWRNTEWPQGPFTLTLTEPDEDGLWVFGYGSYQKTGLFKVNLADLTTRIIPPPDGRFLQTLKRTPDALYATYHLVKGNNAGDPQIARLDLNTFTWTVRPMPANFACSLFNIGATLYLYLNVQFGGEEAAILRYDWKEDKFTILASSRRVPAQNQFDNTQNYVIDAIYPGPRNKPMLTCYAGASAGAFYIREGPGPWAPAFDDMWAEKSLTVFDRTLVYTRDGEVTLIDPRNAGPEHWMAPLEPHFRKYAAAGHRPTKEQTPWLNQTLWDPPGAMIYPGNIGFQDNMFFVLVAPGGSTRDYDLLCYQRGTGRAPRQIPLQFHLDDVSRDTLSKNPGSMPMGGWKISEIEHPNRIQYYGARLVTTRQGLIFTLPNAGFWYLPFADLEAYLKANP